MAVDKEIGSLIQGKDTALGALYLSLAVATVADILPHPMDAVYFNLQKSNRDKFISGEITPKQYWRRNILAYYGCDFAWWGTLFLIAILTKGKAKDKLVVVGTLIGAGAVIGIIHRNIVKDIEEQEAKLELIRNNPQVMELINNPKFEQLFEGLKNQIDSKELSGLQKFKNK